MYTVDGKDSCMVGFDWLRMVDARLGKKIRKYEDRANQFLDLVCLFAS